METSAQKVSFHFSIKSLLKFKFVADIDEASPSEDEAAAQRALRGEEGGYLYPEGFFSIFNKSLYPTSSLLQILVTPILRKMKLRDMLFAETPTERKAETYFRKVHFKLLILINLSTQF